MLALSLVARLVGHRGIHVLRVLRGRQVRDDDPNA